MRMYDIIEKKKHGGALTDEEICFLVKGCADGTIPDYQLSAFLMAVYFKSMTDAEMTALTLHMAQSGDTADLSALGSMTADKHSTGGVGDKTTLIAAPIAAALGCKIAKMSGRGLGHTGGTLDKLESIHGFSVSMEAADFIRQVNEIGIAVIGQSGNMVGADKRLYALRDVTATVDSIPLIASSVMSKKLAGGSQNIVLDVKYGSGAFMKTAEDAKILAEKMIAIGKGAGRKVAAVISSMDAPLGNAVGNAIEVKEAIKVLNGGGPADLREISLTLAALMYSLASGTDFHDCLPLCEASIDNKSALKKFRDMVAYQGGDVDVIDNPDLLTTAKHTVEFKADRAGYIRSMDAEKIGNASCVLGAGRAKKDDIIDPSAGIILHKKTGDYVKSGETIAALYSNSDTQTAIEIMRSAVEITDTKPEKQPLIYDIIM